ncbi:MAG: cytochrome b N-terminal domain-containing protein [Candidatus Binatia bacterium]
MRARLIRLWRWVTWTWSPASEREASTAIVENLWLHWFPAKVAEASFSWSYSLWLGAISAFLFLILTVTGVLLMFFYVPSTQQAYWSIKDIHYVVGFGWLLRNQHRWAAHLMVLVVFLHMLRVFFTGAYRAQRSANWLVGVILLLLTLFLSFTGYLLPWDQLAFWAVTVGTNIAKEAPLVGAALRFILLGGTEIGQSTLVRFYVLHVFVLPAAVLALFAYHMWRVRRDGGMAVTDPASAGVDEPREASPVAGKTYSLFGVTPGTSLETRAAGPLGDEAATFSAPHLLRRLMLVFLAVFTLTIVLSLISGAPLEEPANATLTPNPAKAPWYFLWLQELVAITTLRLGGLTLSGGLIGGILVPGILLAAGVAWPFLDRSPLRTVGRWFPRERRLQNTVLCIIAFIMLVLVLIGMLMRGPYWQLYWPWQAWPDMPRRL